VTHKFSTYLILAVGALGLSALPALAATCANGQLGGTYTNTDGSSDSFSCTLDSGNILLSNFVYSAPGTGVPADNVGVEVDNPGGDGFGLDFTGGWSASSPDTTDVDIKFDVTALNGTVIGDVYIILGASSFTGTGAATYEETFCESGSPCFEQVENPGVAQTDVVTITPTTSLTIDKDVTLKPGASGTVNVSSFGNQYSTVPEPRAVSLVLGLGLLAGFAFFKRRQSVQN
jgi:hypothetical protein